MAGNTAYVVSNLITAASMITVDSENSVYPKSNLLDEKAAKRFLSTSTTTLTIDIDLGSSQAFDHVFLVNHNFTSSVSISIKADDSSPATTEIATPAYRQYDIKAKFTAVTKRYIRIVITDTNSEVLQFGNLFIKTPTAFPRRYGWNENKGLQRGQIHLVTNRGVDYIYNLYGLEVRRYEFTPLTESEASQFKTLESTIRTKTTPFLFIPDLNEVEFYYMRKMNQHEERGRGDMFYTVFLDLKEISRGTVVQQ